MQVRFKANDETVLDKQTGLMWTRDAAITEFPMTWQEALSYLIEMNILVFAGYRDWHLPNRRELFSLINHSRINPSVEEYRVFKNIFNGYYWTSTSCARLPSQAWYVHLGGAKVYRGMKYASYLFWPVRAEENPVRIFKTGQRKCFDEKGQSISCNNTGQDGQLRIGRTWPKPRFISTKQTALDQMTGLMWTRLAMHKKHPLTWYEALEQIGIMNRKEEHGYSDWRMPGIRELESLADLGSHTPSLTAGHPFDEVAMYYWSSTTSQYETRYAWTLYLQDGAVGVGFKENAEFYLWPVRGQQL